MLNIFVSHVNLLLSNLGGPDGHSVDAGQPFSPDAPVPALRVHT